MAGKVKNKIVEAAWDLFYEKGYDNTTIDDIIERSGTSKGSFYYHFESKDAFLGTLPGILDEHYEELEKTMNPGMNSFDKLLYLDREMHAFMEVKVNLDLLASLYSTQIAVKKSSFIDKNRLYYKLISDIVSEGQKRGQISDIKSAEEIVKYYAMCERAIVSEWCLHNGAYSLADYSAEYFPLMMACFKGELK